MPGRRRSYEPGHRRKFLVVVDATPECDRAVYYAARRASRTQGHVVLLAVLDLAEAGSQWLGVAELMRAEATEQAEARLEHYAARIRGISGVETECVIREGKPGEEAARLIEADEDIAILVLAAAAGHEGPGPMVAAVATGELGGFGIPITIVPGGLGNEDIDALA